jgi:hypothetical protein
MDKGGKEMPKGALLTDDVKILIAKVYKKYPKWKAPMVRNEVDYLLHGKKLTGWPSLSSVQKILAILRKPREPSPLDKPWSSSSMAEHPIPPEALPVVLGLWVWTRENLDIDLSIREAQWAARLYAVTKNMPVHFLSIISRAHAITEIIYELMGVSRRTWHSADLELFALMTGQEITPERMKKILREEGEEEEEMFLGLTDKEWSDMQHIFQSAGVKVDFYKRFKKWEGQSSKKEVKNERTHNQEG